MFDYDPTMPSSVIGHPRQKRSLPCYDFQNKKIDNCHTVHEVECHGGCSSVNTIFKCKPTPGGRRNCWYYTVPCNKIQNANNWEQCFIHFNHINEHCDACCVDKNCGGAMLKCPSWHSILSSASSLIDSSRFILT